MSAAHHLLLSHGMALPEIRNNVKDAQVGITLNLNTAIPASPSEYDKKACTFFDNMFNRLFLEPLYNSKYPTELFDETGEPVRHPQVNEIFGTFKNGCYEIQSSKMH